MQLYNPEQDSFLLSNILEKKLPKILRKKKDLKFLEIGSGFGINLEKAFVLGVPKKNIFSCDINPDAVKECRKKEFNCVKSDLFEKFARKKFDVIIFNPPYLPLDENEPEDSRIATTGGKFGSEVINRFLNEAKKHINSDGVIFMISSSLTKKINWEDYKKKKVDKKRLFFEEIYCWEIKFIS